MTNKCRPLSAPRWNAIEKVIHGCFAWKKHPLLIGEISVQSAFSLAEIETVLDEMHANGKVRQLTVLECVERGWYEYALAFEFVE